MLSDIKLSFENFVVSSNVELEGSSKSVKLNFQVGFV